MKKPKQKFHRGQAVVATKTENKWHEGEIGKIVKIEFCTPSCRNRNEYLYEVRGACQAWHFFFEDELRAVTHREVA